MFSQRFSIFLVSAALTLVPGIQHAAILYVDSTVADSGDGTEPHSAFASLDEAVESAHDGDEIRVMGGEHHAYEIGTDTNGLVLARAGLRLVGWGGRPVLVAATDVTRPSGGALMHVAGADAVISNLCIHFSNAGASSNVVLSVEAPRVTVADCEFMLTDSPSMYQKGGAMGVVSCERGDATDLLVKGCTFRDTRPANSSWEYRVIMPRDGAQIVGNFFTNVNVVVACKKLGANARGSHLEYTRGISFVSNLVVDTHCMTDGTHGGVLLGNYNGPRSGEVAFNRFVNFSGTPSGSVVRKHREGFSTLSLHHNTVVGFEALVSTGNKSVASENSEAHVFDNLLAGVSTLLKEEDDQGRTAFQAGSFVRANAADAGAEFFDGTAATTEPYAETYTNRVEAAVVFETGPVVAAPYGFGNVRDVLSSDFYRWRSSATPDLASAGWTDGGAWPTWIGALKPREPKLPPLVVLIDGSPRQQGQEPTPLPHPPDLTESGAVWRVTALDPSHLVLQADFTGEERAAFKLTAADISLTGWKFDNAFYAAADRATADRAACEAALSAGPFAVAGASVASSAYWKIPNGLLRFPDGKGHEKPARAARLMHTVYLVLHSPLAPGADASVTLPDGSVLAFAYDPDVPSPLFKVNQVGYNLAASARYAYLGGWLGPLGAYPAPSATTFELVDATSGAVALSGPLVRRMADPSRDETPFCGEETVEMDISAAPAGRYFLRVAGVGRSEDFDIGRAGLGEAFALHMKGLYHQRCGIAKTADLTRWTDNACHLQVWRGVNPPNEGEYNSCFTDATNGPIQVTHFQVNSAMIPTYTESLSLPGGWHDAGDYDRRPMHMRIVGDLATVYLLRPGNFTDSQLAVPERGNDIPDILDEAAWGLRHLLAGQQADGGVGTWIEGTRHPNEADAAMPSADPVEYCLSRATRLSSMDYAGYAALLARALRAAGSPSALELAGTFQASAERAWTYATTAPCAVHVPMTARIGSSDVTVYYDEETGPLSPECVAKAAVNLYALTGEAAYADELTNLVATLPARVNNKGWSMSPLVLAEFGFTDVPGAAFESLRTYWTNRVVREADAYVRRLDEAYPYRFPWYGPEEAWVYSMSWGAVHPHRQSLKFIAAHAVTGAPKYLDAAYLANDFHCGCNPNGSTWTSGLGRVYPTSYLSLASCADGLAEYVPGISPYRNTYGIAAKAKEWVWDWDEPTIRLYPFLRRWANVEGQTVAASEFTVWETIAPAAAATGYLMGEGLSPAIDLREPATNLRDLPGYWALP